MEIRELTEPIEDFVGTKGLYVLIGGAVLFGVYNLLKDNDTTLYTPTGYTSYPDAEKNADVIIDSVNQHNDYNTQSILMALDDIQMWQSDQFTAITGQMGDQYNELLIKLQEQGVSINDYINQGLTGLDDKVNNGFLGMQDQYNNLQDELSGISGSIGKIESDVSSLNTQVEGLSENQKSMLQKILDALKPKTGTSTVTTSSKNTSYSYDDDRNVIPKGVQYADGSYYSYSDNKTYSSIKDYNDAHGLPNSPVAGSR